MKKLLLLAIVFLLVVRVFPQQTPEEILNKTLDAIGGKEKVVSIRSIHLKGMQIDNLYSIAVREKGAIPKMFWKIDRVLDFKNEQLVDKGRLHFNFRQDDVRLGFIYNADAAMQEVGDKKLPASLAQLEYFKERLQVNPVYFLQQGIKTNDLKLLNPEFENEIKNYVLQLPLDGMIIKVLINSLNYLLTEIVFTKYRSQDIYRNFWGDETTKITYSGWILTSSGIKFPTRWIYSSEGFPTNDVAFTELEINPVVPADTFKISNDLKDAFLKQKSKSRDEYAASNNDGSTKLIDEDIYQSPGIEKKYNSTIIKQNDGIVIIDAPFSSSNSEIVIKKAKELFPGEKIKAVISSNQVWMHIAGLREYAADGIPIYLYEENKGIVEKLLDAEYISEPDKWQKNKKKAVIKTIVDKMSIGTGKNRIEIIPVRTGSAQRTMAVYFPNEKILYASDLYQPKQFAHRYWSAFVSEIKDFVEREGFEVEKIYSLHMPVVKYSELISEE